MREIFVNPGEQILVTCTEEIVEPEPEPVETGFNIRVLDNFNGWRHYSHVSADVDGEYVCFGLYVDENRRWKRCFRFIDITTGESRYLEAPSEIYYNSGVRCELHRQGNKLFVSGGHPTGQGVRVYECTLVGSPVTDIVLDKYTDLGVSSSRPMSSCFLKSGAFVVSWYEFKATAAQNIIIGYAYRDTTGAWREYSIEMTDGHRGGQITSCNGYGLAQHPADDSLWLFYKRDSYHQVSALAFDETDEGLECWYNEPEYICAATTRWHAGHSPEGENPSMEVVALPERGTLMLAMQSNVSEIFKIEYDEELGYLKAFIKGAWPVFTEIKSDGEFIDRQFNLEVWHERLADFGLLWHDNKLWCTFNQMHEDIVDTFKTPMDIFGCCYDFATDKWGEVEHLGVLQGYPLNNVNQPHSEAQAINALTFHSPDNQTTLITVK